VGVILGLAAPSCTAGHAARPPAVPGPPPGAPAPAVPPATLTPQEPHPNHILPVAALRIRPEPGGERAG